MISFFEPFAKGVISLVPGVPSEHTGTTGTPIPNYSIHVLQHSYQLIITINLYENYNSLLVYMCIFSM